VDAAPAAVPVLEEACEPVTAPEPVAVLGLLVEVYDENSDIRNEVNTTGKRKSY
jgi:hypothetical protein